MVPRCLSAGLPRADGTSRYFDLQGRQLRSDKNGTPVKGLYIDENGKKHINK